MTPNEARRDQLRAWTGQELARIGQAELAEIFLFTDVDPAQTSPQKFFFGRCWYEPTTPEPVSLLIPPALPQAVVPPVTPVKEVWRAGS